jgi:glycosyltransferase involved in cell wall biosynthesis
MLKVAFGATALLSQLTGLGQYALHLAKGLREQPGVAPSFFYGTHFSEQIEISASKATTAVRSLVRRFLPHAYALDRAARQRFFDAGARRLKFDVYHEPNYLALKFQGPTVITVHDLSWIRYPHTHPSERVRAMNTYFESALRRASRVLTDSEFVRGELIQEFGLPSCAVQAIPLGLDPSFRRMTADQTRSALEVHGLSHGGYFLSVGTIEPRKNMQTTLAAYSALPTAVRKRFPLVIAGMRGWRTSPIERQLEPMVDRGEVRALGYLEREDLAAITAGALALVYPSLYEGFGLPPLEAMGCGVPAIVSNVSSLPELVGNAGMLVSPMDVDALADAMRAIADDGALRRALSELSVAQAARFSWSRCVSETVNAYRLAASTSR